MLGAGCAPTCEQVCAKVVRCEVTPGLTRDECEESCNRQDVLYELEQDDLATEAFAAHRRCVASATCEELEDGVCYDEQLFAF